MLLISSFTAHLFPQVHVSQAYSHVCTAWGKFFAQRPPLSSVGLLDLKPPGQTILKGWSLARSLCALSCSSLPGGLLSPSSVGLKPPAGQPALAQARGESRSRPVRPPRASILRHDIEGPESCQRCGREDRSACAATCRFSFRQSSFCCNTGS